MPKRVWVGPPITNHTATLVTQKRNVERAFGLVISKAPLGLVQNPRSFSPQTSGLPVVTSISQMSPAFIPIPNPLIRPSPKTRHLVRVSSWLLLRDKPGSTGTNLRGQLGGAQIGLRASLMPIQVTDVLTIAPTIRFSSPLFGRSAREVAPGLVLQLSTNVPLEVYVERRIGASRESVGNWAAFISTGVSDFKLPRNIRLNGYVQAGVVGRKTRRAFAGGNLNLTREIIDRPGLGIAVGSGLWGDVQKSASRVDIGPVIDFRLRSLPIPIRLSAEWRFRVSGRSAPSSGPAIVAGADF